MRSLRICRAVVVALACFTWILPLPRYASAQNTGRAKVVARPTVQDVALGKDGRLVGQFVDAQGQPIIGATLKARQSNGKEISVTTNETGYFAFKSLTGGTCQITGESVVATCRCWTSQAAPPAAAKAILIVKTDATERGQQPISALVTPLLIGAVVAAAIAIPIAVHNSKRDRSDSSL